MILRAIAILMALATAGQAQDALPYRGEPYNAPVPDTLDGAVTIGADQALELYDQGVAFVDVYPRTRKPEGLPEGTIWREPRHDTIPGALWLWDTGYVRLSPEEQKRLEQGLLQASVGDIEAKVVVFCRADCWMSWNAAKRAVALGYRNIHWFPDGTDGWQQALGPDLVRAEPFDP